MRKPITSLLVIGIFLVAAFAVIGSNSTVDTISARGVTKYCTITAPSDGSTVSGIVTIVVDGSSTPSISIDGAVVATSYTFDWDTSAYADGTHSISAKVANKRHTISVTVANGGDPNPDPEPDPEPDPTGPWTPYGTDNGDKYALCIGISDYEGRRNDLNFCDDDAIAWKDHLVSKGYYVLLLTCLDATADNIEAALLALDALEDSGDKVVVTYSGHGGWYDDTYGSCWISTDLIYFTHGLVDQLMDNMESTEQFIFTDACESGSFNWGLAQSGRIAAAGAQGAGTYTYDASEYGMGAFTYFALANNPATAEQACIDAVTGFNAWLGADQATWYDGVSGDFIF